MPSYSIQKSYGLTDKQFRFLESYVETGDIQTARKKASISIQYAYSLMEQPQFGMALEAYTRNRLARAGALAIGVIQDLAHNSTNQKVKLDAAKDLADRAGYKPEHNFRSADSLPASKEELMRELQQIVAENPEVLDYINTVFTAEEAEGSESRSLTDESEVTHAHSTEEASESGSSGEF